MKKKITIVIIVLIAILVVNFIYTSSKISGNKYERILDDNDISTLFNKHQRERITLKSALGNKSEQIYFYKSINNVDLIIYKTNAYNDVNLNDIHMYLIDSFEDIQINPQRIHDMGYYKLTTRLDSLKATKLKLFSSLNSEIIKHFENDTTAYVSLYSDGLVITNNNNIPHIKFSFNKPKAINLYFKKKDNNMYLLFLSSNDNTKLDGNILLDLIE